MHTAGTICFASDHPALPGHFPGRPLVPGVLLLDAALAMIAAALPGTTAAGIARVKFLAPVGPEQELVVCYGKPADGRVRFACLRDGTTVIDGVAVLRPGATVPA